MTSFLKQIIKNPLFSGSAIMIVGTNLVNLFNYVYHLIMGRSLGPANYGELATLISLIGILSMIPYALGLTIVKFTSSAKDETEVVSLYAWFNKRVFIASILLSLFVIMISPLLAQFLNITNVRNLLLMAISFVFFLPSILNRSFLQGLLKFREMVFSNITEVFLKFVLGVFFVFIGWSVFGAMGAIVISAFGGWIVSKYYLIGIDNKQQGKNPKLKQMISYSGFVLVQSIAMTSLYSGDLVLVKHFFTSHDAGLYAALSMLGRIIFFGAGPIAAVMFPIISQRQSKGSNYKRIFYLSLLLTMLASSTLLLIYFLFPQFVIFLLYGKSYLEAAPLLFPMGVFITLFTISSLIVNFYLSLGITRVTTLPFIAAILQIVGIVLYHNSLSMVINVSIIVSALLLISLFVYFLYESKTGLRYSSSL